MVNTKHHIARQVTDLEAIYHKYDGAEAKYKRKEKNYKKDLQDLIEYVKWITDETSILRARVGKAEGVIQSLRKSGESSVEALLKTFYQLRQKQMALDNEAELLRVQVNTKERMIKMKEDEKGNLKTTLENEKNGNDFEFSKLRKQLDEQKALIGNQRKLLNKLQVLNEVTQGCITQSSAELANKMREKQTICLSIDDQHREQGKLKKRHNYLETKIQSCIPVGQNQDGMNSRKYEPEEVTILPDSFKKYNQPNSKYVDVNRYGIRSQHAFFGMTKNGVNYDEIDKTKDNTMRPKP